jgi:hypothetical protein
MRTPQDRFFLVFWRSQKERVLWWALRQKELVLWWAHAGLRMGQRACTFRQGRVSVAGVRACTSAWARVRYGEHERRRCFRTVAV